MAEFLFTCDEGDGDDEDEDEEFPRRRCVERKRCLKNSGVGERALTGDDRLLLRLFVECREDDDDEEDDERDEDLGEDREEDRR